jgi:putative heme iron utilization protein
LKNKALETRIADELLVFLNSRRTLHLSTVDEDNYPYASYAPYAIANDCFYVLLSDIALHGVNLKNNGKAGVLIVEDESEAEKIFARIRVNYQVNSQLIPFDAGEEYDYAIDCLFKKQGDRIHSLRQLTDFNLFKLTPFRGRFVRDFGRAYAIIGSSLTGENIAHLRVGHKSRAESPPQ